MSDYAAMKPNGRKYHVFKEDEKFCYCRDANELEVLNQPHKDPESIHTNSLVKNCARQAGLRGGDGS